MFQVCPLFESVLTAATYVGALLANGPLYQCRRSFLHLRLRLVGKEGVDHAVLRLKCLDQSLAFAWHLHSEFGLLNRRSLFGKEVSDDFFRLLARPSAGFRPQQFVEPAAAFRQPSRVRLPSLTSLVLSGVTVQSGIRRVQDAVTALAIDRAFAVIGNPEAIRVHIGTLVGN